MLLTQRLDQKLKSGKIMQSERKRAIGIFIYKFSNLPLHLLKSSQRDNVVYWKTKRKINDDLQ